MSVPLNHPAIRQALEKGLIVGSTGVNGGTLAGAEKPVAKRAGSPELGGGTAVVTLTVWIPGLLPASEANKHDSVRAKIGRKKAVKGAVALALAALSPPPAARYRVKFVRVGGHKLDGDNLARAGKSMRDIVSKWLSLDDGDEGSGGMVRWQYSQRPNGFRGVVKYEPGTRIVIVCEPN